MFENKIHSKFHQIQNTLKEHYSQRSQIHPNPNLEVSKIRYSLQTTNSLKLLVSHISLLLYNTLFISHSQNTLNFLNLKNLEIQLIDIQKARYSNNNFYVSQALTSNYIFEGVAIYKIDFQFLYNLSMKHL